MIPVHDCDIAEDCSIFASTDGRCNQYVPLRKGVANASTNISGLSETGDGNVTSDHISQPYRPPRPVTGIALLYGDGVCFL
jgi:hypothetical protein